jgi:hypothetical protein
MMIMNYLQKLIIFFKKKSNTKTSEFNSVDLIPKFEFECLMQGYRVDPKDNDDNSIPDNCEVSFESINCWAAFKRL